MIKNGKRGFTLVELLAAITIMSAIATMVSINVVKIFEEKDKARENSKTNVIETSACVYIKLDKNKELKEICKTKGCTITANELIAQGLLDEKDVDKNQVIHIYYDKNEMICKIQEG